MTAEAADRPASSGKSCSATARVWTRRRRIGCSSARGGRRPACITGWLRVDHKRVGRRYIVTAFVFFLLGGLLALLMRLQLARPENDLLSAGPLQPALHHARHDDDVSVRRAGHGGGGDLPRAAHARHAQHRLPAAERLQLLDLSVRRRHAVRRLRR